jgi:outer membrane protein assembly factor BamB
MRHLISVRLLVGLSLIATVASMALGIAIMRPINPHPLAAPTITSFAPTSGTLGTVVTITGTNFVSVTAVELNGHSLPNGYYTVESSTQIKATLPWSASSGPFTVVTTGGSATSSGTFTVTNGIALSASVAPPGGEVAVNGTAFGASEVVDLYLDTLDVRLIATLSTGDFSTAFIVPTSTTPGTHYFTAIGRRTGLVQQINFTVRSDWAQFHNGPLHKGFNQLENVLNPTTVQSIDRQWSYTTGSSVYSSPAVANGVLYIGSFDGKVYAIDASAGTLLWSYTTGSFVGSSPAVANGIVYIGSDDYKVYALNATTGALVWSFTTGGIIHSSSPAVANGIVYVGSEDHKIYALNATTGALLWSYTTGGIIQSSPAVANGIVYVGSGDDKVYALNATTGALLWSYTTGGSIDYSSPAVANGAVYIGSDDDKVYALNATTGALLWSYTTGGNVQSSPAVANGAVYIGSDDDKVYALNATTGALLWSYTTGGNVQSSPAVADGVVYIYSNDGKVYAFNATTGALLWSYTTSGIGGSSPAVVNGMVYIGSQDANVYAFSVAGGMQNVARPNPRKLHPNKHLKAVPSLPAI